MSFAKTCKFCGKSFITRRYAALFCSSECCQKYRRKEANERLLSAIKDKSPDERPFLRDSYIYYSKSCPECGRTFETKHIDDKYCSTTCQECASKRNAALIENALENPHSNPDPHIANLMKVCADCGKRFMSVRPTARFCSHACYLHYRKIESLKKRIEDNRKLDPTLEAYIKDDFVYYRKSCKFCGKSYETIKKNSSFCSDDCFMRSMYKKRDETRKRNQQINKALQRIPDEKKGVYLKIKKMCPQLFVS